MTKFTLSLLFAVSAIAQPTITLTGAAARPGSTATVTVSLTGASGVALQFFVPQIPGAVYVAAAGPALPAGKTLTCATSPLPIPVLYGCIVVGGTAVLVDGVIATLTFPAPAVGVYPLPVSLQLGASAAADAVTITAGAPLSLTVLTPCDVNGDGVVNSTDVTLAVGSAIQRLITAALDLTGDGAVNVVDVQRVVLAANGGGCRVGP